MLHTQIERWGSMSFMTNYINELEKLIIDDDVEKPKKKGKKEKQEKEEKSQEVITLCTELPRPKN